jgi:phosphate transport system substrate-binding protein
MRLLAWAVAVCVLLPSLLLADVVTLTAKQGQFSVSGDLRSFDGAYYRLLTDKGPVTLRADAVVCVGTDCPADGETTGFTIAASHSVSAVLVPALIRAFAAEQGLSVSQGKQNGGMVFTLAGGGQKAHSFPIHVRAMSASEAFAELAARASDIAITDRSISAVETTIMADAGLGDFTLSGQEQLLALDGLALVVSPRSALRAIAPEALALAVTKPAPVWGDIGAPSQSPLTLTLRAQAEDLARLRSLVGPVAAPIEYRLDGAGVAQSVRAETTRLGVLAASEQGATRALRLIESCGLSHAPDLSELAMGRYPWLLPIKSYLPDLRAPADLQNFADFLASDAVDAVISRAGFARPGARPLESDLSTRVLAGLTLAEPSQLARLQALARQLGQAEQVGISVPAQSESGPVRGLRRLAVRELARGIVAGDLPPDRLLLLASGPTPADAERYAQTLLDDLAGLVPAPRRAELAKAQVSTDGVLLPVACPDAPWADWMNARIDIWVLPDATGTLALEN